VSYASRIIRSIAWANLAGDYVEFTLSAPPNALTVRYAVPDGPEGKPVDAKLAIIGEVTERDDHKPLDRS
jgi:hypothetical protein